MHDELRRHYWKTVKVYFPKSEYRIHGEGIEAKLTHREGDTFLRLERTVELNSANPVKHEELVINKELIFKIIPLEREDDLTFGGMKSYDTNHSELKSYYGKKVQIYFLEIETGLKGDGLQGELIHDTKNFLHLKKAIEINNAEPYEYSEISIGKKYIFSVSLLKDAELKDE